MYNLGIFFAKICIFLSRQKKYPHTLETQSMLVSAHRYQIKAKSM